MPDDIKEEVTEQIDTGSDDEGFSGGFTDETASVKEEVKEENVEAKPDKTEPEKKPEEAKAEADKAKADADKAKADEKAKADADKKAKPTKEKPKPEAGKAKEEKAETEEDEAEARGKQLLEEEKKAEAEAAKAKEEADRKAAEAAARTPKHTAPTPLTSDLAKIFFDIATGPHVPEVVKVGDADIEIRDFVQANPEFAILAGIEATNIIQRFVDAGVLVTSKGHQEAITKASSDMDLKLFDFTVRQHIENPSELWDSKEFQDYYSKAGDTFKALFRSNNPMDHVKGFNKYLGKATERIKDKVKEIDAEAAKKKKTHDDIHAHTMRSGTAKTITEALGDADEEFSAGFSGEK